MNETDDKYFYIRNVSILVHGYAGLWADIRLVLRVYFALLNTPRKLQ